jgi:ParB-like chromosome segregation protein Spo0J
MSKLKIETVEIKSLKFDPTNARQHDEKNIEAIAGSLKLFGQRKPIVITPDNVVVAGNGTLQAAINLGWNEIVITQTPVGWTWDQIKAYALSDNRTAELAEWNPEILKEQILELDANGWELSEFGFESLHPPTGEQEPLKDFPSFDDTDETKYQCPKCSYEWNGASR